MVAPPSDPGAPIIEIRGLRKRFGSRVALAGVDLRVTERQIVAVTGPDGAGKTTLLRTLAGLLEIDADVATVLGHDLRGDVTALKEHTGYVPQSFGLQRDLSVADNLRFTARLHRIPDADFRRRSEALLARTALTPFAGRLAGALSGGMKQKLAVANALIPAPALLVLDEPTAGVDVVARLELWSILEESRATAAVVVSTSYLDEAERADRLVYLDAGRVVADGVPAALRSASPRDVYRAWTDDAREVARAARALPWAAAVRASGRFARIEVERGGAAPAAAVIADAIAALPGVALVEPIPPDMESTLRHLANAA
jgi:ABC-2 type transport system ATP-binding protein